MQSGRLRVDCGCVASDYEEGMLSRWLLGCLWGGLAAAKAADPGGLRLFLTRQDLMPVGNAVVVVWIIIALEGALGIAVLLYPRGPWLRGIGIVSLLATLSFLFLTVLSKDVGTCGCLGALGARTLGRKLIVIGALLYLSAAVVWPGTPTEGESKCARS